MGYETFRELRVWQEAKGLAVRVHQLTSSEKLSRDFGLRDQMRRASVSVASNIAEGYERSGSNDFTRFMRIAQGSLSELRTQLDIAREVGYGDSESWRTAEDHCAKVGAMLTRLINARRRNSDYST